jgi:hypothetical protein
MAKRQRRRQRERRREHAHRTGWKTRHSVITGVGVTAGTALGLAAPALGATQYFYVGSLGDSSAAPPVDCIDQGNVDCTLRQAVAAANANSATADYIYFRSGLTGTITLTAGSGGEIPITDATYLYGPGPDKVTVHAASNSRIFNVNPATSGDTVGIGGMTLTGGNVASDGGAIFNDDSGLRLFDTVLSGNTATGRGGAVYEVGNYNNGDSDRIRYTTFTDNHATIGGAISADVGWGTIRQSTFSGNGATAGNGGALYGQRGNIYDSTFSGNSATGAGGGVGTDTIVLYGTILANNSAPAQPDLDTNTGDAALDLVKNPGSLTFAAGASVITGQDPQLGPLQNNGGDMPTLKPSASSPVVDQSYSGFYYDQRFGPRIVDNPNKANVTGGNGADIGAVELSLAEGPQAVPPPPAVTPVPPKKKCKKKKKKRSAVSAKKCKKKKKRSAASSRQLRFRMPLAADSLSDSHGEAGDRAFRLDR